jgi:hypothetical protein
LFTSFIRLAQSVSQAVSSLTYAFLGRKKTNDKIDEKSLNFLPGSLDSFEPCTSSSKLHESAESVEIDLSQF